MKINEGVKKRKRENPPRQISNDGLIHGKWDSSTLKVLIREQNHLKGIL